MTETVEVGGTCDIICNLKAAITALECQENMNLLRERAREKAKKPPAPMYVMIPLEEQNGDCESVSDSSSRRKNHKDHESEYSESSASKKSQQRKKCDDFSKGPGIRGGVLHTRCNCIHRDGLQDSCPLTECRDEPKCETTPWANCKPAKYFRSRFPDNYP